MHPANTLAEQKYAQVGQESLLFSDVDRFEDLSPQTAEGGLWRLSSQPQLAGAGCIDIAGTACAVNYESGAIYCGDRVRAPPLVMVNAETDYPTARGGSRLQHPADRCTEIVSLVNGDRSSTSHPGTDM